MTYNKYSIIIPAFFVAAGLVIGIAAGYYFSGTTTTDVDLTERDGEIERLIGLARSPLATNFHAQTDGEVLEISETSILIGEGEDSFRFRIIGSVPFRVTVIHDSDPVVVEEVSRDYINLGDRVVVSSYFIGGEWIATDVVYEPDFADEDFPFEEDIPAEEAQEEREAEEQQ